VTGFDTGVHGAGGVDHLDACFTLGPHDQMVLEEPAEHLTAVALETLLERTVLQHHRLIGAQERDDLLEVLTRRGEGVALVLAHRAWPLRRARTPATRASSSSRASTSRSLTDFR
jgi:hypothetical protein